MRRIVAMGGGGFSAKPPDPALDQYVLDVAGQPSPRICLLPTASGDPHDQIHRFYRAYGELACTPTHLSLFRMGTEPVDLRTLLLNQDVIYVGGGSLLNLIAIWRAHGLHEILRQAWEQGTLLCGISAGSMCWFTDGVSKSHGAPQRAAGLCFLPFSNSVHYRQEPERRPCFMKWVGTEEMPPGYGVDDGVALLFAGTDHAETVSARDAAGAWWVESHKGETTETPLDVVRIAEPQHEPDDLSIAEYREARTAGLAR